MSTFTGSSQRLFVHFSDARDDILRYRVSSVNVTNRNHDHGLITTVDQLRQFINDNVYPNDADIKYELEIFDRKAGRFEPLLTATTDHLSKMKSIRVLIKPSSTTTTFNDKDGSKTKKEWLAIGGRRFGSEDAITIRGMQLVIVEHHECFNASSTSSTSCSSTSNTKEKKEQREKMHCGGAGAAVEDSPSSHCVDIDGNTGLQYWDSAIVLAKYLEKNAADMVMNKRILELGGGTGVVGISCYYMAAIAAAAAAPLPSNNLESSPHTEIVVTDLRYAVPNLVHNIKHNVDKLVISSPSSSSSLVSIYAADLDWNAPEAITVHHVHRNTSCSAHAPSDFSSSSSCEAELPSSTSLSLPSTYDVVVGSDIIWLEHLIPCLVKALVHYAGSPTSSDGTYPLIVLAHETRTVRADELFFGMMRDKGFGVTQVDPQAYHPQYQFLPKIKIYHIRKTAL